ncbi:unconventional myosin-XVIIIa-like [Ostrinia nubilalis]|uniref:unconventional myosin-XVIIIa-like n=1 Tax=Ostrinia nubilalis TaxID=29057 RepID=UPI003082326E
MPAVKVFNIFGGQKPQPPPNPANAPVQKFYRTFSVGPETPPEHKTKVTAIAACLEKKISDDNVPKLKNCVSVNGKTDANARQHVYENVNIANVERDALLDETKGYSSIYENIVIVKPANTSEVSAESKLNKALQSFDKILSEFNSSTSLTPDVNASKNSFIVPKLQKSKTCSIIESRCILKKANSDSQSDSKTRSKVARNNSIDKTTSLWNLDDMKGKELTSPLMPLAPSAGENMNSDKYATYKISSKNPSRLNCIKNEDLKKLDVKTRILKKTLSNPPSTPVPVISKTKPVTKKLEKRVSDPKKTKSKTCTDNGSSNTKTSLESKEAPKSQMQKAKSVWEIGNEVMMSPSLERTRSTTSIAGSPSKIPVIRSHMSHNKFSSTRALFSPTPVDLNNVDQARECAQKKKQTALKKPAEKSEPGKQIRQKSQLSLRSEIKRQLEKVKKELGDNKKIPSPKAPMKDYTEELNAVRAKIQQRKINKRDIVIAASETKRNGNDTDEVNAVLTPVKSIVKKLELKTAMESKADSAQFVSCKIIPAVHKELCVANTTFHNHLSTLVGRQIKYVESRNDSKICSQDKKLELHKHADEKISDTHSDCSDDSGHVSNDAANDNDPAFDNVRDLSPVHSSIDEVDCKIFDGPKEFGIDLSENAKTVCPVRPARRNGRANEVASGTRATDAPKVDEQIMFRGGVVGGLDARRDAALARVLVRLQARARGLLARRRAQRLRTQHTAARCVQRNVRAFLAVRDWPWWRLLVRVTPLLAVHRTEHRLKQAQEELETLRAKLDKVENERTHYKNETEKLETKLSEVGGELAEERAAAALATERADAEAAERLRVERDNRDLITNNQRLQQVLRVLEPAVAALATERADAEAAESLRVERDNRDLITNNQRLQQASERLELELLHWRSAESGGAEPSDSEGSEADASASGEKYKRRYESAHREVQLLRAQLRRQHEDDLEQLVSVKKQLEKKVQDAYEEVEEQRAVAAQWKRKLQKLTNDMADLRSLLDEQTCRNNLLEKRQRKFDAELHGAQEELKRERAAKERLSRERDQAHADKYALEQSLSEARLELELKEERLAAAARELEERGGGGDEVAALRRARTDLERRVRDQEEELDDLAGQIQLLESSKLRLEMLLEQQRKEARLEAAARDDEMEETRANAAKKLKMLESQLESEHSERSLLLRERHELERRLAALEEAARADSHEQAALVQRLKRDLKRYRALLRDAQTMLEQKEKEGGAKAQIRQLKNQVEDLELAVRAATKAKQTAEAEASEATAALEEATRAKNDAAERALTATRDAAAARAQLDDAEEEAAELLKKYRSSANALCAAQAEAREASARAEAASEEARQAKERLNELTARLTAAEAGHTLGQHEAERRLEMRNKELESSLELEATARARLEGQLARLRDAHEQLAAELGAARARDHHAADELRKLTRQLRYEAMQLAAELGAARARDHHAADELRKLTRQLRELKEENSALNAKLSEAARAKAAAEGAAAAAAADAAAARDEARLAARRATALQEAIAGDLSSPGDSRDTDSDNDSYSSDESIGTFLANHKLSPSAPSRNSLHLDSQKSQSPEGRGSRASVSSGSKPISPSKESFA